MMYSEHFKERMVQKLLGPSAISAAALSREVGVPQQTLSRWLREMKQRETVDKMNLQRQGQRRRKKRPAKEKIRIVMEAAALSEDELGAFLRKEGLHEAELERLQEEVLNAAQKGLDTKKKREPSPAEKELKQVKKELARKEKALAETAALLVLRGKLEAFFRRTRKTTRPGRKADDSQMGGPGPARRSETQANLQCAWLG